MKLVIFAYPRTGSTLLSAVIGHSVPSDGFLGEAFNTLKNTRDTGSGLVHDEGNGERLKETQMVPMVLNFLRKYQDHDYILKLLTTHVMGQHPYLPNRLANLGYRFIMLERRDPFAAVVSHLVAHKSDMWCIEEQTHQIARFRADMRIVAHVCEGVNYYYHWKERLAEHTIATLYFEDIIRMTPQDMLDAANLRFQASMSEHPKKQQNGFEVNRNLIRNVGEVRAFFEETVDIPDQE